MGKSRATSRQATFSKKNVISDLINELSRAGTDNSRARFRFLKICSHYRFSIDVGIVG